MDAIVEKALEQIGATSHASGKIPKPVRTRQISKMARGHGLLHEAVRLLRLKQGTQRDG